MNHNRNVLAIGVTPAEFDRVLPFLSRQAFDVDRFPSAVGALELVSRVSFEMLLVRFPLPDMDLSQFLAEVRQEDCPCRSSSLLLLTTLQRSAEAKSFIGKGANRTIELDAPEAAIHDSITSVLNVAPRKAARFMAQLEISLGGAKDMLQCQTENLSATGMLIRTDRRYESGTEIEFEFALPDDPRPVRGVAEIARHTIIGHDQVAGVGVRFLSFAGDSQRRFQAYIGVN